ncbi:MAG TPA: DNA replication/repair protein RecF [Stellaceae bacterium]|nr:DNA replication/repair protein RecF [Stellaceae bacterium]
MLTEAQEAVGSAGATGLAAYVGVTRLNLTDFRNYREARLDLGSAPVVLTGANGAGKTNLLEALSFLAPGRGLRGARLGDIDRRAFDADGSAEGAAAARGWAVAAVVETRRGRLRIGTGRDGGSSAGSGGERRIVRIDGEPVRGQAALGERLGVLWLTPAMDRLFVEGPAGRRRFLDRLVLGFDPQHASRLVLYEQAARERARLLRDGPADSAWLTALEAVMAAQGIAIAAARRELVRRLDRACAEGDGPFPRARLALLGTVEDWLEAMPALAAEERLAAALCASRRRDALSGGAEIGPHRSDLGVALREKGVPAALASTGEQKALLVSILLADARLVRAIRGEPPLLLLDEIAAHLDPGRRAALFEALLAQGGQTWLTGTEPALFATLRPSAQFLSVRDGAIAS